MHITLRFAGDIDGRTADEFVELAGRRPRQAIPGDDRRESAPSAAATRACCGRAWRRVSRSTRSTAPTSAPPALPAWSPKARAFKPHVTLARMRGGRLQAVARFLTENGGLRTQPFTVTRFVLLSARPGSGGGPYVVEAKFPFEGTVGLDDAGEFADDPHAIERVGATTAEELRLRFAGIPSQLCMPQLCTVATSMLRKMRFSTTRPIRITVNRPANTAGMSSMFLFS